MSKRRIDCGLIDMESRRTGAGSLRMKSTLVESSRVSLDGTVRQWNFKEEMSKVVVKEEKAVTEGTGMTAEEEYELEKDFSASSSMAYPL